MGCVLSSPGQASRHPLNPMTLFPTELHPLVLTQSIALRIRGDMLAHACNHTTQEVESGGISF